MSSKAKSKFPIQKEHNMPEIKIQDYDTRSQPPLHKNPSYEDSSSKDENYLEKSQTSKPVFHENQLVCLSCLSDQFPLQQYIKEGLHEGHQIMRVSEAELILHKKMSDLDEKYNSINKTYTNNRDRILKLKKQLLNTLKDLKQNLKKQFQDLKTTLEAKQNQIVRCAEIMISTKFENLDQLDQKLQKNFKNLVELEDIFKQTKDVSYQNYSIKKSKLDTLLIQSQEFPQKPTIEIDFISFTKIISEIEVHKNKIANICLNNHMNIVSLNSIAAQYQLYQDNKKLDTKKTYNRPTIASIGDELVHDQYSSSIFLSRVQAKKLIDGRNTAKDTINRIASPKLSNEKQKQGAFQQIMRLNLHRDNFHSRQKLTERRSRSNKMIEVGNYLKESFRR